MSANEKNWELTLPGKPFNMILPPDWLEIPGQLAYATSISRDTEAGRRTILDCVQGDTDDSSSCVNKILMVEHVFIHPIQVENQETGEVKMAFRTVLVGPTGSKVAFVSSGIVKSLALITATYRDLPWSPPMGLLLERIPTNGGRSMYRLTPEKQ